MLAILQQSDAEQAVAHNIERLDELRLLNLNVGRFLQLQTERFAIINSLHRLAIVTQFHTGKQRRMSLNSFLDGFCQAFAIQAAVERI